MPAENLNHPDAPDINTLLPTEAKGAIWDMDGTLFASNEHRVKSWGKACKEFGLEIDSNKYMAETGRAGKEIVAILCKEQGVELSEDQVKELVAKESSIFKEEGMDKSRPIPVVMQLLEEAKRRGLKMAVASGGEKGTVMEALDKFGLNDTFDTIVTSHDVENSKPAPDIFLLAAKELGLEPSQCVVYEDAVMGIEAAKKANIGTIIDVTTLPGHPDKNKQPGSVKMPEQ